MRSVKWLCIILGTLLVGILVACGTQEGNPPPELPTAFEPTAQPTPVLGAKEAGPLPEYRMALTLDPAARRLSGQQQVVYPNRTGSDLNELVFRLYPNLAQYGGNMNIGPVWVDGQRGESFLRAEETSLVIPLPSPLPRAESVTVDLTFDVQIPEIETGYVLFGLSQGIWSLPDAYPLLAVHRETVGLAGGETPWYEDIAPAHSDAVFAEAAYYDVTLTLPPTLTLATTGKVVSDTLTVDSQNAEAPALRTYHILGGPLREFAWLASEAYSVAETTAYGTVLRSYYLPGDDAAGQATLNIAAAALRAYQDTFGPYPFEDMSVAEAPLLYLGMEYPGLNLIGMDLYRDQRSELEDRVAHEIAHQWWYAQVGNDQINTPWLDEGLAEYSMAIYYEQVFGEAHMNTLVNQRWLVPYQVAVDNEYDSIVNQPSSAFTWEYEVIVYGKAALFFHFLRQQVGAETFKSVLHEYTTRYRWRIATPDDVLRVAESVSGQDLDGLYNHWILSKQ